MHIVMIESNPAGISAIAPLISKGIDVTFITADKHFYLHESVDAKEAFRLSNCSVIEDRKIFNSEHLEAIILKLNKGRPIDGVITYSEYHIVHTAKICKRLSLLGMSVEGAMNCRNKYLTRKGLEGTGIRQPRFILVESKQDFQRGIQKIGFPCVIKPLDGTASLHVLHLKNDKDLENYLNKVEKVNDYGRSVLREKKFLMEEFVEGEIVSVETCVHGDGSMTHIGITDRYMSGFPYFIEMGLSFDINHPFKDDLYQMTTNILNHLKVNFGFIHTEFIITQNGPYLLEVNGRLGGGVLPKLMEIALGKNPFISVVAQALGEKINLKIQSSIVPAARWWGAPIDGILKKIDLKTDQYESDFIEGVSYRTEGENVNKLSTSNFDWMGHFIFTGKNRKSAFEKINKAIDKIELDIEVKVLS